MGKITKQKLEKLYRTYNRREFVHPDPLEFLYHYDDPRDQEIVGLIASSLAFGRVAQILKNVSKILERMKPTPSGFIKKYKYEKFCDAFADCQHRWTRGDDIAALMAGMKGVIEKYGSLEKCFAAGAQKTDETVLPALTFFVDELICAAGNRGVSLVSSPLKGSACKRLNLFLRWMVRKDAVDLGCWKGMSPSKLIIPLDTHMYKIGKALGFTDRKQANLKTAVEITHAFKKLSPDDPVKYDFALTRLGIRSDTDMGAFLSI